MTVKELLKTLQNLADKGYKVAYEDDSREHVDADNTQIWVVAKKVVIL